MIFKQAQEVVDGRKRQTRRPVKPGEYAVIESLVGTRKDWRRHWGPIRKDLRIVEIRDMNGRLKWQVGKTYAAQPGRGKKAIGRTPPIEAIRRERLQEITPQAAKAEGVKNWYYHHGAIMEHTYIDAFVALWNSLYGKPDRWRDNPDVWVVVFEELDD